MIILANLTGKMLYKVPYLFKFSKRPIWEYEFLEIEMICVISVSLHDRHRGTMIIQFYFDANVPIRELSFSLKISKSSIFFLAATNCSFFTDSSRCKFWHSILCKEHIFYKDRIKQYPIMRLHMKPIFILLIRWTKRNDEDIKWKNGIIMLILSCELLLNVTERFNFTFFSISPRAFS